MLWIVLVLLTHLQCGGYSYFDFELYHNTTEEEYAMQHKKAQINTLAMHGFGRILTWNVKKLGACLRQDNVEQLKEVVCVVLQSANIVALQEAENLDLSCLPCATVLKDEYEWPGSSANDEFRILVKTRHSRSFSVKKLGVCDIGADVAGKKSHFDDQENIYQTVMREYQRQAEKKHFFEVEHVNHAFQDAREEKYNALHNSQMERQFNSRSKDEKPSYQLITEGGTFIAQEVDKKKSEKKNEKSSSGDSEQSKEKGDSQPQTGTEATDNGLLKMSQKERETKENENRKTEDMEKGTFSPQANQAAGNENVEKISNQGVLVTQQNERQDENENVGTGTKDNGKKQSKFEKNLYQNLKDKGKDDSNRIEDPEKIQEKYQNDMNRAEKISGNKRPKINRNSKMSGWDNKENTGKTEPSEEGQKQQFSANATLIENDEAANFDNEKDMSVRQKERFHNKESNESEEDRTKGKAKLKGGVNNIEKEDLKERLYRNREILKEARGRYKDHRTDKLKLIDSQLKKIEKELKDIDKPQDKDKKEENRFINKKFKDNSQEDQRKENRFAPEKDSQNKNDGKFSEKNEYKQENEKTNHFNSDDSKTPVTPELNRMMNYNDNRESQDIFQQGDPNNRRYTPEQQESMERSTDYEDNSAKGGHYDEDVESQHYPHSQENKDNRDVGDLYSKLDVNNGITLKDVDLDSEKMHDLVHRVLANSKFIEADEGMRNEELLEKMVSKHGIEHLKQGSLKQNYDKPREKRTFNKKKRKRKSKKRKKTFKAEKLLQGIAEKRQLFSPQRDESLTIQKNLNYVILVVKSDLNSGEPFIIANVKFPKEAKYQRACMEKVISDISNVNSEYEKKLNVLIMGDFHFDRLSGSDAKGELYKIITNLQIDGENYHSPITYLEKDPITTVYGRRFDNILSNINSKGNIKTIGPDFPLEPESVILPITLQRLYNNYITALYTTDNDESDKIYECIKAFQMAGKNELEGTACKNTWVPSSYISDHLPLQFKVKMNLPGKSTPIEVKLASWNIQGDTFKERLLDPSVRQGFLTALKKYHVAIFHEFPPHDRIIDDQELGSSDIVRLKQGQITTEFGIYVSEFVKDGETDMYVLRKKFKNEPNTVEEVTTEVTPEETKNLITTVGLFAPKIVVDTVKIRPCLYTVKTSKTQTSGVDFSRIINAIDKDVQERKCDFKVMLASLNLEENFDLDKEIYKSFKYINLKCLMNDGDNKYKYNIPRSRDLADYVIVLGHESDFEFGDCTIGLPGDEYKRGIDKLSDFEELTTHYPLSMVVKQSYTKK